MQRNESIGAIVYTGGRKDLRILAVNKTNKLTEYNGIPGDVIWRLPTETKKEGEDDYQTLERGLMEELNIDKISRMTRNPVHVFNYPLPDYIKDADFHRVKVYAAKVSKNSIDGIKLNHRELEGYAHFPIGAYRRLYWQEERKAVSKFCKLKNIDPHADI